MINKNTNMLIKVWVLLLPFIFFKSSAIELSTKITTLDKSPVNINQLIGDKPLYIKFWASWCQQCMEEMPHLQNIFDEYGDSVNVFAVNIDLNETDENIQNTINKFGLTLPIYKDDSGRLARELAFIGTPYHVLIDADGDIVHKGSSANKELDRRLGILSQQEKGKLPIISLQNVKGKKQHLTFENKEKYTALYLTSTWCDWYLKESRPAMSKACIEGQNEINNIAKNTPQIDWKLLASHLWTGSTELKNYIDKYKIQIPADVDTMGDAFFSFKVKDLPTLILLKGNNVIGRTNDVNSFDALIKKAR